MKNNKKGFTLIELLAVIIILGILMIIAIPSVTNYISNSRKSAYVNTAKEIIAGTRNVVNEGKLGLYDSNTTYYIPSSYIKTENASKSPYGEFVQAYAIVIYDGQGYKYYWTSVDDAGQGVKGIIPYDNLDEDDIESDLNPDMVDPTITKVGIGDRTVIKILNSNTGAWEDPIYLSDTSNNVSENGEWIPPVPTAAKTILETANQAGQLYQIPDTNIYIFSGAYPSNYVRFNNEYWRIIGIYGNQLKIIKASVHTQQEAFGYSSSSEEWESSQVLRQLEGIYYEEYLSDEAKEMIDENAEWYVAGFYGDPYPERSFTSAKARTWNGKIGLLNVYEYLYAAGSDCINENGDQYRYNGCTGKDWLFRTITVSDYLMSMLINRAYYDNFKYVFSVACDGGSVYRQNISNIFYINPVVYLKPSVMLSGGSGTYSEPYTLSINS